MVRVISVHNFVKQDITSVDELIDTAVVPPDVVLLVQSDHTISVRDLSCINEAPYSIPTVDQVVKIIYSIQGNYIGTLEKKLTRNGVDVFYIRIYLNWESLKNYKELPPMRARIAGRVTPLSQNHDGLEMIEIPANTMPDNISCCPISGNLIVSSRNVLVIYKLKIETHDISKMSFIDFEQVSVDFLLSFIPTRIRFVENLIAVQNDDYLHVFRILGLTNNQFMSEMRERDVSCDNLESLSSTSLQFVEKREGINYEKLLKQNYEMNYSPSLDKTVRQTKGGPLCKTYSAQSELSKINTLSFPVRHDFPTIALQKSLEPKCGDVQKQNPFINGQDLTVNIVNTSENSKIVYRVESLLQYQLIPLMVGSFTNREMQEKFTCLILKPFYSTESSLEPRKRGPLESEHFDKLKGVACFFGTQQEGYLHCLDCDSPGQQVGIGNYVVYPFTAPVVDVKLEDSLLHALTDTGLETYTVRAAQHLMRNNDDTAAPSHDDPVCLIGLRPFVNIFKMCLTQHYLILFANNEESSNGLWTLYKLSLPTPSSVWCDFLSVANENKWEAPATYSHLVGEGHLILKTYLNTIRWFSRADDSENHMHSPSALVNEKEKKTVDKLYNESCALLGDFHIMSGDFLKSSNYYKMSTYKMSDIVKRIEGLADKIPETHRASRGDSRLIRKGLIYHFKKTLSLYDQKYAKFTGNREEFYNVEIGNIVNFLLDYLEKECSLSISDLILDSVVLREFSTDRILKMMKNVLSRSSPPEEKDALSLALICIQRDQMEQAKTVLLTMTSDRLQILLQQYHHLLFEESHSAKTKSFTDLSMVLIETHPTVIGRILSHLVTEKRILNVSMLLKIFLDIVPAGTVQSRNSSVVLQIVLENYFKCYFDRCITRKWDFKLTEALKILIRIYLTFLKQRLRLTGDKDRGAPDAEEDVLFHSHRHKYLNRLPPFGFEFSEILSPKHEAPSDAHLDRELKNILFKLQSLLSYENLPSECLTEVRNFICNQTNVYGSLSLQVLSAVSVQEGVQLLINFAPQAVVQYIKDRVKETDDWKYIIRQIQIKINASDEDSRRKSYYHQTLNDILLHGAKALEIEDLVEVLPRDVDGGEKYLTLAQNNAQANHIRTLIMTTGKQLQTTLYDVIPQKNGQVHT